jgi:16S rRNA C1402 (ribose-2'-O) methylase RsmI
LLSRPTTKKVDSVDIFELEAEQAYDSHSAVFCFFEDLHRIQDSLMKLWKDCAAGQTSVVAATSVTEAAVLTIRRAEQEICANLLPNQSDNDCYEVLAKLMVMTDTVNKGLNPVEKGGVDNNAFR